MNLVISLLRGGGQRVPVGPAGQNDGSTVSLTGVLVDTTTPTTATINAVPDRCVNLALTMIGSPGTYKLAHVTFFPSVFVYLAKATPTLIRHRRHD
jgi:hypothetical protein